MPFEPYVETTLVSLAQAGVRYLVVGGVAVNFTGFYRATKDLDILPDLESSNLEKLVGVLASLGFVPRVPINPRSLLDAEQRRSWHDEKGMLAFTYIHPQKPFATVDLMIFTPLNFEEAFLRRQVTSMQGTQIYFASIDDLIAMKQEAHRQIDLLDIKTLREIKEQREDTQ